ncbi:ribonuclease-3 [Micromonospora olivasterospora]|uniref:Ribonuclease-3 n=1 Tax=Micromonospora olivasterospora TaxID=1880 RepID=A0A562ICV5_MICOL|nr:ribonuclease-3 [Micromonospora olivasterospora]
MTNDKRRRAPVGHLEAAFGVSIEPDLLERALTHRSYAYENGGLPTNERLEFLGDSVLGVVITTALFHNHPDLPEGQLAKLRASVVNMRALADVARASAPPASARTCCSARGRRAPAGGTRRASSPTPWRPCWARSTSSTGWTPPPS